MKPVRAGSHVVVSGGTGFVGRFIVSRLLAEGCHVTLLGRNPPKLGAFSGMVDFHHCDLEPDFMPPTLFNGAEAFVHAAFHHVAGKYRGGEGADAETFRRRNLVGSVELFRAAKSAGVGRIVFLSSRAVYGVHGPGVELDELMLCRPDTLYGEVKLVAERALQELADDRLTTVNLRATGIYGVPPGGSDHKWSGLIADYIAGKAIAPRIGTEVHGDDVAAAVYLALTTRMPLPPALNISDILLDRHDLLALVRDRTLCPHPLPARSDPSTVNAMSSKRLEALGWRRGGMARLRVAVDEMISLSGANMP